MTLNISVPTSTQELRPKITVVGVGGAGGNAVNNMIEANLEGVEFLVTNTDGQALMSSLATRKIQLGRQQTEGLGAGSKPEIGRIAAEESLTEIMAELADSHMVFITAGMGGGTGTGAAPVIARAAREAGMLTVGVVTKPFDFEGQLRMRQAKQGIDELQAFVDTLIIIPNQNLFRLANERTTLSDAFSMADQVLHQGVCGVTDLMIKPGMINLDFADIRSVMSEMGKAMMGTGEAAGEGRATNAAEAAINNPLLDETTLKGARAVLININGGNDMTLFEVDEAANHIRREVDPDATIIFGTSTDERLEGIMRVSVVATGMAADGDGGQKPRPAAITPVIRPITQPRMPAASEMHQGSSTIMQESKASASSLKEPAVTQQEIGLAETETDEAACETLQSPPAFNDPDQGNLVMLAEQNEARGIDSDSISEPDNAAAETTILSSASDAAAETPKEEALPLPPTDDDAVFIMRETASIDDPQVNPASSSTADSREEQEKTPGILQNLSRIISGKPRTSQRPQEEPTLQLTDAMISGTATAEDQPAAEESSLHATQNPALEDASSEAIIAPQQPDLASSLGDTAASKEETNIASLADKTKPAQPPRPDNHVRQDILDAPASELEIPAFLRRQAN